MVEEDLLVGEDVGRVPPQVVVLEQVVVEEARRPGAGHDERRVDDLDVALRPGELDDPLLVGEGDLRPGTRRPSGTRSPRRTAGRAGRSGRARGAGPGRAAASRSCSAARVSPSSTSRAESPIGPSVGAVRADDHQSQASHRFGIAGLDERRKPRSWSSWRRSSIR